MSGKLIIVSAPSGSGKTTIVKAILNYFPELAFSVSACSRAKRPNEVDGKDYYFLTVDDFKQKIANNEFVEWQEVYEGSFYGTLKSELNRIWNTGKHVVFDVDVVGGVNLKNLFPNNSLAIFIQPPSLEVLKQRLIDRKTETAESLQRRISKAQHEMTFAEKFDKIIINNDLETAVNEAKQLISAFLNK